MKNLILMAAIATMPLVACNANGASTNATEQAAPAAAAPQKPDLGFLTAMGLDVSNLNIINDVWEFTVDMIDLNKEYEERMQKILSEEQYKQYKQMCMRPRRPFGQRGGHRGGPRPNGQLPEHNTNE